MDKMEQSELRINLLDKFLRTQVTFARLKKGSSDLCDIEELQILSLNVENAQIIKNKCKSLKKLRVNFSISFTVLKQLLEIQTLFDLTVMLDQQQSFIYSENTTYLQRMQIKNLDQKMFPDIVSGFPQLVYLGCIQSITQLEKCKPLKDLKLLKWLSFSQARFSQDELGEFVRDFSFIKSLTLKRSLLRDKHIKIVCDNIDSLQHLNILQNCITNQGLEYLQKYAKGLKSLNISGNNSVNGKGINFISNTLHELKQLVVSASQLFKQSLNFIGKLCLHKFVLEYEGKQLKIDSINNLFKETNNLKILELNHIFDNQTIRLISYNLKQIQFLNLQSSFQRINNSGAFYISKLRTLKRLDSQQNNEEQVGLLKMLRNLNEANFYFSFKRKKSLRAKKASRNTRMFQLRRHMIVNC